MKNKSKHIEEDVFLAKWMANEMTDVDFEKLVSEEDYLAYKKLKKGILLYEKFESSSNDSFHKIQQRIKVKNKPKIRGLYTKWLISVAASILLFFGITTFFNNQEVIQKSNFGEQKTIALLDGSKVILSPNAIIKYEKDNWETNRELYLEGEAFFNVKKGSIFTVKTKNGNIQVLGTQFNVKSNGVFFEVFCYSGKVKVTSKDKEYILKPSDGVRKIGTDSTKQLQTKSKTPTWTLGESTYKSIPIKYVIIDLESQFNIKFDTSKINSDLLFTGFFDHKNKELALKTVFKAMNIEYRKINTNNILLLPKI